MGIHIVGLNFDPDNTVLMTGVKQQTESRDTRAEMIAERLAKKGIVGALEGAKLEAGDDGVVGRPHFAKYMVKAGYVSTVNQAFKSYLGAGKPGDVKQLWPDIATAISWITAAGGVAVLAHPDKYNMTRTKLRRLLEEFAAAGGQAMEVVSGHQDKQLTHYLAQLADRFELHASCGSDFHVPDQPWQELGKCSPLPESCEPVWRLWQGNKAV